MYLGRVATSGAIFVAAVIAWREADRGATLLASLLVTATLVFTLGSLAYSDYFRRALGRTFLTAQAAFDLAVVTAIVHLTGGASSQFAGLYILVIATAALLLLVSRALLIAALGCALYFGDVLVAHRAVLDVWVWLQLGVFTTVALLSAYLAARLREARAGTVELAAELHQVRLQAADILRNIRSGIITVDPAGRLLYANPTASRLLGMPLEDRVGDPILQVLEPVAPVLARALERAATDGSRVTRAEGTITVGPRSFPIGLNTTVSDTIPSPTEAGISEADAKSNGSSAVTSATAIFQDISDQKRLDMLHMRAERLEAVAELSSSLAHEIKNPLASIRSAVEQLSRSPRTNSDEQLLASLIVRESDRLSRLLSEFLDFSRVRVTKIEPMDLLAVTRGAASLAAAHPDRPGGVQVECNATLPALMVEGDEDLLHRAMFNLILNAVQASPQNGKVRVELVALGVDDAPAGMTFDRGGVAIRVSDE
ncbi:MAG TPA: histidine kinase dimerization/phospho-acceptor domain-containing protein, partial [Gemmatimonadaceae bacterium]|nr:histidine kinase dimerization/phospho-acceptor domain-containing protein [Gemmatimonadaceae bacterium]